MPPAKRVLYRRFTRSLVFSRLRPRSPGTVRLVLLPLVCVSHVEGARESALGCRSWLICRGAEIVGLFVFLRRREMRLLFSSDIALFACDLLQERDELVVNAESAT